MAIVSENYSVFPNISQFFRCFLNEMSAYAQQGDYYEDGGSIKDRVHGVKNESLLKN